MSKHVVVGAGPVGTATTRLLVDRGEQVVLVTRSGSGPQDAAVTRIAADASSSGRMSELAAGSVAIYNCVNPPYHRWATDWPPIADALLSAAERSGAVLATVSNLYGYGPVDGPMTEDLPLVATGPKGQVRAQMWRDALAAHTAGRVRATEVRSSDYVGRGSQSHLGREVPKLLRGRNVAVMRSADTPHTWTAVDDVARLLVTVAGDARAWGRPWHTPSNPPRTQREGLDDIARVAGLHPVKVGELSPTLLRAMGLFSPMMRELPEVAYQFERPFVLDSTAAQDRFGLAPTDWEVVLKEVVDYYRSRT
ncbi:MAG: NAD-dependent epimerase/dehydratase family protein [Cellulomonas sp.]